jgi:hypothetical protein
MMGYPSSPEAATLDQQMLEDIRAYLLEHGYKVLAHRAPAVEVRDAVIIMHQRLQPSHDEMARLADYLLAHGYFDAMAGTRWGTTVDTVIAALEAKYDGADAPPRAAGVYY